MNLELKDCLTPIVTLIGIIVTLWQLNRQMKQKNIEEERAKWRERMRELGGQIAENAYLLHRTTNKEYRNELRAKLCGLISELQLRLNPFEKEDIEEKGFTDSEILELAEDIFYFPYPSQIGRFEQKMQLLLKWEWERAKKDSGLFSFFKRYGTYQENYKYQPNDFYNLILCFLFVVIFVLVAFFISVIMLKNPVFKDVIIQIKIFLVNL